MHIPPGFLEPRVWIPMNVIAITGVAHALKKTGKELDEREVPIMGVVAAFIFAAQMVNFPVWGGTSGHLIGAALAVVIFGMWPAMVIMTSVIVMQALLFQDGGLEALGANVFNMGIVGCYLSGLVIRAGQKLGGKVFYLTVACAGWLSVVGAAVFCAIELALSGTTPFVVVLPAMTILHAIIGVFEGFLTIVALRFITMVNPSLVHIHRGGKQ